MNKFPCYQCGACCKVCHLVKDFPEPYDSTGRCSHLQEDNSCGIYDTRPDVCRIEKQWDGKDWDKFVDKNLKACKIAERMVESLQKKNKQKQ